MTREAKHEPFVGEFCDWPCECDTCKGNVRASVAEIERQRDVLLAACEAVVELITNGGVQNAYPVLKRELTWEDIRPLWAAIAKARGEGK